METSFTDLTNVDDWEGAHYYDKNQDQPITRLENFNAIASSSERRKYVQDAIFGDTLTFLIDTDEKLPVD